MSYEVKDFEKEVVERSHEVPVLVDFWAPWCGPCRTLGPMLERMADQAAGRWELVKVNTEEHEDLAAAFNIASIPAVKLFVGGAVADEFTGALPEREIRRFLEKAIPSPDAGQVAEAQRLLGEGALAVASRILEPIVQRDPGNLTARVLLAQAVLSVAPETVLNLLAPITPDSEMADKADALRVLARLAMSGSNPEALPAGNVRERYLEGIAGVRAGDFAAALPAFIDVLARNKGYDGGGAKDACKAIFVLLGPRHPVAESFFRAFSSALHS